VTKPRIGVYRTVYPLYSETFISEQIRSYKSYQPVLVCRELVRDTDGLETVSIGKKWRFVKKLGFSALGLVRGFDDYNSLRDLRLLHAHFAQDATLALPLAKKLGIPLLVTCHGSDVTVSDMHLAKSLKLSAYRYLFGKSHLIKETSRFIAVSDFLRNKMIDKGYPADKVVRNYVGVDVNRFTPRQKIAHQQEQAPFFLSIARHTDVKGLDILLQAFSRVVITHPKVHLVQIGGGDLTESLKAMVVAMGIENNVSFLGPQASEKVLPFIQSCIALVLSSRKSHSGAEEAFGLVLTEAAACAVPCIGTRVGGIPEAIVHGETGFLTAPGDVADIADKMTLLLNNPDLAESMGKRGREMVCDIFDIEKQTGKLEDIYAQFL
jgi:glycosyltransferase involved in cell wall biosynthesis